MNVSSPDSVFTRIRSKVSLYTGLKDNKENKEDITEPLLKEDHNRFCIYPIQYPDIWTAYKNHKNAFWTAEEIDFTSDKKDWDKLNEKEKYFIEHILAFFAGSDGIVLENLVKNFCSEVTVPEARCFYAFQAMMENIHSEVYSLMIDTFIEDYDHKKKLFKAITEIPCIEKKAQWALQWIENTKDNPFGRRLFAFGIVEGLFFSGSFCAIFWLKERGLMTQTLGKSNEWIARDESLHTQFAILLYKYVKNKIKEIDAHNIMIQAVLIEEEFICESLPVKLIGMDHEMMKQYIRYCADRLLSQFGYKKIYYDKNPFPFMEKISMDGKTNFFEQRVSEYSLSSVPSNNTIFNLDNLDYDFF